MKCNKCKSDNIVKAGKANRSGGKVQKYYCNNCFHFFTE